jgi:hypothetical protein
VTCFHDIAGFALGHIPLAVFLIRPIMAGTEDIFGDYCEMLPSGVKILCIGKGK